MNTRLRQRDTQPSERKGNGATSDDMRWIAPWRANAAARADQTRLIAKSAMTEAGHTLESGGAFGCTNQGNCPKHGQLEELYGEVRAHTDRALDIARKREPEWTHTDGNNRPKR